MPDSVLPPGWIRPRGYAHGMLAAGKLLAIAGQIGTAAGTTQPIGFADQFVQALDNVITVVIAAGGRATDIISLTVFVTDRQLYQDATTAIGQAWRARLGDHYPAMTLVVVVGLLEPAALVEIQGLAILP